MRLYIYTIFKILLCVDLLLFSGLSLSALYLSLELQDVVFLVVFLVQREI